MKVERDRAWRRFKKKVHAKRSQFIPAKDPWFEYYGYEKNWKWLGRRWDKLQRAKQLGFEYPRITVRQLVGNECYSDE